MITRRDVLRTLPLISLAPSVPGFLARSARATAPQKDGRVLVVIQLEGGNDGINTVVPFKDEGYGRNREALALPLKRLISVTEGIGLHPAMQGAGRMLEAGRLAIVPGVGYPNPDRSHFRSMAIWHTARLDPDPVDLSRLGWIGRGLDARAVPGASGPASLYIGAGALPSALRGTSAPVAALEYIDDLTLDQPNAAKPVAGDIMDNRESSDSVASFVQRAALDAYATADRLAALGRDDSNARYPSSALAQRLGLIARLLKGGLGARVFYTSQTGYDTHGAQPGTHFRLLDELSGAIEAFHADLGASGLLDRVLVMAFSEFGRRVAENGSAGTDHGTSGPVFLAGTHIQSGLIGLYPSLTDLVDGDLKMTVDFRRIYATVLEDWLGLASKNALNGTFERMPLFRPTRS
jgi:uncharacterized protein (DUF1501 family)